MKQHALIAAYTLIAGGLATASLPSIAEDDASRKSEASIPSTEKPMQEDTRDFIVNAAKGNMGEAMIGETAKEKATSDAVRNFADKIAQDHKKANEQLKTIAQQTDIQWPSELREPHHDLAKSLQNLEGKEFDETFANRMVQEHEREVQKYERLSQTVGNKAIKDYIDSTLPVLRSHLEEARQIQQQLSTASR